MPETAHFHVPSIQRYRSDQERYVHDEQKTDSCHRLENTAILSGTSPTGAPLDTTMSLIGCTYFVAYSLVVLVAPVLVIAALLLRIFLGATGTADADLPSGPLGED